MLTWFMFIALPPVWVNSKLKLIASTASSLAIVEQLHCVILQLTLSFGLNHVYHFVYFYSLHGSKSGLFA